MLYKVTPMMDAEPQKKPRDPAAPRKRRATSIYDRDGNEVLVSLMCLKCKTVKPLAQFGLRRMADGAIRNQPWCRSCRSGASAHKPKKGLEAGAEAPQELATSPQLVPIEHEPLIAADALQASVMAEASQAPDSPDSPDSMDAAQSLAESPVVAEPEQTVMPGTAELPPE